MENVTISVSNDILMLFKQVPLPTKANQEYAGSPSGPP